MAKYELVKKTEINGEVWYFIRKGDGYSVENSWTMHLEKAERMFQELESRKNLEPTFETLKTIEVNDPNDN
jgi:DNA-directed RNA polymerase specialized sigma subunit